MQGLTQAEPQAQWVPLAKLLLEAAQQGDLEGVRSLIDAGAPVNGVAWTDGIRPLTGALHHPEIAKLLLSAGADATASNVHGMTALHYAMSDGHLEVVRLLLEAGAKVNQADGLGCTPLHFAARGPGDRSEVIALLLQAGAQVGARHGRGGTPLHEAAASGQPEHVKLLLDAGADVNALDDRGWLPIHEAAACNIEWLRQPDLVRLLLAARSKLNVQDKLGNTPLHWAAWRGHDVIVAILLDADADAQKRNKDGKTPADLADSGLLTGPHTALAATIRAREKHGFFGFGHRAP